MLTVDLKKFREVGSCRYAHVILPGRSYRSGCTGEIINNNTSYPVFCAIGKLAYACGAVTGNENNPHQLVHDWRRQNSLDPKALNRIGNINNQGQFERADAMILQWAAESGKFRFVNGLPEQSHEFKKEEAALWN